MTVTGHTQNSLFGNQDTPSNDNAEGSVFYDESEGVKLKTGSSTWTTIADTSGGGVTASGTPSNNELAVWVDSSTVEGASSLTWDGSTLSVGGTLDMNGNTLNNLANLSPSGSEMYFNGDVDVQNNSFFDVNAITGGEGQGNSEEWIDFQESGKLVLNANNNIALREDNSNVLAASAQGSYFYSSLDMQANPIENISYLAGESTTDGGTNLMVHTEMEYDKSFAFTESLDIPDKGYVDSNSSRELKTNITALETEECLDTVLDLEPVSFEWEEGALRGAPRGTISFVAEDTYEVDERLSGSEEYLDEASLTAVLAGAVQELAERVEELEQSQ